VTEDLGRVELIEHFRSGSGVLAMRMRFRQAKCFTRKATAVILLASLVVGIGGIPMMKSGPKKDRSRPFPCQDRPCGCTCADECWHHCCCFTNKQKVAWAREHGVTPPDFVVAAQEGDDQVQLCEVGDCCTHRAGHPHQEPACCRSRHGHPEAETGATDEARDEGTTESKVTLVVTGFARQCSGLPPVIFLLTDALPLVAPMPWKPVDALAGYVIDPPGVCTSAELAPPVPPPKLSRGVAA